MSDSAPSDKKTTERLTIRLTEDVGSIQGVDGRTYDLRDGDVVTLPEQNAAPLLEKEAAVSLDDRVQFRGPPEPVVTDERRVSFFYPTVRQPGDESVIDTVDLGTWECQRCGTQLDPGIRDGDLVEPHDCPGCERQGPFEHAGPDDLTDDDVQAGLRTANMWHPPAGVSDEDFLGLWGDVQTFIYNHWDAGSGEDADAVYAGLTAYALSTWVRENLTFVPHLMLMGKTTGGKTRLLNTLARVSYRAVVSASATPASMFRLIDAYDVSYFVSEYHGLHHETRRELDAVVRAGQKRNEVVTRAEPTSSGHEPRTFDPFTHVAVATQYEPDDDIVNRCIQVQSSTANRDMPATHDEKRAEELRNRLLYARFRLLESDEWNAAEERAYDYLADRDITGRTREKLLGLLTIGYVWDQIDALEPFVDMLAKQDREAAADSEDALVVEAIRDLAFSEVGETVVLGDGDPFAAVEIPYQDVADAYEDMTGSETSASWIGHVRKRLGLEKARKRDGTVISDPDLGPKLRELCDDLNLDWEPSDVHDPVEALPDDEQGKRRCSECGRDRFLTHHHVTEGYHMCEDCAESVRKTFTESESDTTHSTDRPNE